MRGTRNQQKQKKYSETGNWTPVSRVTGGDTHHYTISDYIDSLKINHSLQWNRRKINYKN